MIAEQEIIELKKINKDQAILNKELVDLVEKLVNNRIEILKQYKKK